MLFLIGSSYHYASGTESKKYIKSSTMVQNIQKHFDWGNVGASTASPPKKGINGRHSHMSERSLKKLSLKTSEN